jgi:GTP-binding protein HflX
VLHPLLARGPGEEGSRDRSLRLSEASGLAEALDLLVVEARVEPLRERKPGLYFGEGKADDIGARIKSDAIDVVFIDAPLTPVQQRNLERLWQVKVVDRTGVILEIFARRARTREGRLQVEAARLSYERSRLVRTWTHLERQRGGLGKTGGPGETQIELDRRLIAERITRIRTELEEVRRTRGLHRQARQRAPYPVIALVGYTNAGKSSLFNRLSRAQVLAKDMPFATLDPTMRAVRLPSGAHVILSDTVGFITDLPTELIAAFRATLEEVAQADVLVHVRDIAHAESEAQRAEVLTVLDALIPEDRKGAAVVIEAWNKIDQLSPDERRHATLRAAAAVRDPQAPAAALLSALSGEGMDELLRLIEAALARGLDVVSITAPAAAGAARAWLYGHGQVVSREPADDAGAERFTVRMSPAALGKFAALYPDLLTQRA